MTGHLDHQSLGYQGESVFPRSLGATLYVVGQTKEVLSTTSAHTDFMKSLLVIPPLGVLVSGSSDKATRIW